MHRALPRVLPAAALVLLACQAPAPAGLSDADRQAIEAVSSQFVEGVRAANWDAVAQTYTADAVLLPPNAPAVTGRDAIRAYLASFPPLLEFSLTNEAVEGAGDIAYVRGRYAMKLALPGEPVDSGKYLEVRWREPDGTWRLAVDIWNSSLPPAPAAPPSGQ